MFPHPNTTSHRDNGNPADCDICRNCDIHSADRRTAHYLPNAFAAAD